MQNKLKEWMNEASKVGVTLEYSPDDMCLMYKGFKLSYRNQEYKIKDMTRSDFYTDVEPHHLDILMEHGFIKGADMINYQRNIKRVENEIKTLENLHNNRDEYEDKVESNPKFFKKKIRNCEDKIDKHTNNLFFYKSKVQQYEERNNII